RHDRDHGLPEPADDRHAFGDVAAWAGARSVRANLAVTLRVVPPPAGHHRLLHEQHGDLGLVLRRIPLLDPNRGPPEILTAVPTTAMTPAEQIEALGGRLEKKLVGPSFIARIVDDRPGLARERGAVLVELLVCPPVAELEREVGGYPVRLGERWDQQQEEKS